MSWSAGGCNPGRRSSRHGARAPTPSGSGCGSSSVRRPSRAWPRTWRRTAPWSSTGAASPSATSYICVSLSLLQQLRKDLARPPANDDLGQLVERGPLLVDDDHGRAAADALEWDV